MATRVTFRMICVAGLIPTKTTLTGGGTEVALEALIQALARMLIIVPVVSGTSITVVIQLCILQLWEQLVFL